MSDVTNKGKDAGAPVTAVHLDAVGGIAGDMFAAALLDIRPDLWPACAAAIAAMDLPPSIKAVSVAHNDGLFSGSRFTVAGEPDTDDPAHNHVHWRALHDQIAAANLDEGVRDAALGIFTALAEAEAAVHGIDVADVAFHEVGAYDSIIDVVTAAAIITNLGDCRWSVGPIPRGNGQVRTQHGVLPVPAPATLQLLTGFTLFDDGESGERVTPTGAAILRYLQPAQSADPVPRRLLGAGVGFGTKKLASRSNVLRATLYAEVEEAAMGDMVEVLRCEIDDQSGEDLAVAVDHLREAAGVIDICQWPVFGKKGRMATALQVLARPEAADGVVIELFNETSTLGVRRTRQARSLLGREVVEVDGVNVKLARRPSGLTAKAEMDDLAAVGGTAERRRLRRSAEAKALAQASSLGENDSDAG